MRPETLLDLVPLRPSHTIILNVIQSIWLTTPVFCLRVTPPRSVQCRHACGCLEGATVRVARSLGTDFDRVLANEGFN